MKSLLKRLMESRLVEGILRRVDDLLERNMNMKAAVQEACAEYAQEMGYRYFKVVTTDDEKTCGACRDLAGKIFSDSDPDYPALSEYFSDAGLHPNCRCYARAMTYEELKGKDMDARKLAKMALNAKGWEDIIPYRGFVEQGLEEDEYDFETWTMLAPEGTYVGTDTEGNRIEEVLDAESLANLAEGYEPDSAFIDKDHESMKAPLDRDTEAYGWISELKTLFGAAPEYNGLYAKIKWTDKGRELVTSRAYRFMSPAFQLNEFGRPVKLVNSALTNRPNFSLPPIINSETEKETITEEHDMDIETLKEEIINACMERMKAEAENTAAEETKTDAEETDTAKPETEETKTEEKDAAAEKTEEKTEETANACGKDEETVNACGKEEEEKKDEVIKAEALNSASETQPTVADAVKQTQEWRNLRGEDLMRYYRRQSRVIMA